MSTPSPAHEISPGLVLRGVRPPLALRDYKLIAFDMDSTLINIECVDEIADAAGRRAEVSAITDTRSESALLVKVCSAILQHKGNSSNR